MRSKQNHEEFDEEIIEFIDDHLDHPLIKEMIEQNINYQNKHSEKETLVGKIKDFYSIKKFELKGNGINMPVFETNDNNTTKEEAPIDLIKLIDDLYVRAYGGGEKAYLEQELLKVNNVYEVSKKLNENIDAQVKRKSRNAFLLMFSSIIYAIASPFLKVPMAGALLPGIALIASSALTAPRYKKIALKEFHKLDDYGQSVIRNISLLYSASHFLDFFVEQVYLPKKGQEYLIQQQ